MPHNCGELRKEVPARKVRANYRLLIKVVHSNGAHFHRHIAFARHGFAEILIARDLTERMDHGGLQDGLLNVTRRRVPGGLAVTRPRCETIPAIDGLVAAGLKRNLRDAAALAARGLEHLALAGASAMRSAAGGFTRGPAIAASARFVRESFTRKELLLARRERECASAIDAGKGFVGVH